MAEGEGFEPPVPFQVQRFSRPPVSTTHTSLRAIKRNTDILHSTLILGAEACLADPKHLRHQAKRPGMKLHDLGEVGQEIVEAMVAGIKMILVLHAFFL